MNDQSEITQLLLDLSDGNKEIVNSLMPKVYKQLHQVAMNQLKGKIKFPTMFITNPTSSIILNDTFLSTNANHNTSCNRTP